MKKFMITWMSHNIAADHYETNQVCVDGVPFVTNDFDVAVQHMAELLDDDQDAMDGDGSQEIEGDEGTYIHSDGIVKYKIVEFEVQEPKIVVDDYDTKTVRELGSAELCAMMCTFDREITSPSVDVRKDYYCNYPANKHSVFNEEFFANVSQVLHFDSECDVYFLKG